MQMHGVTRDLRYGVLSGFRIRAGEGDAFAPGHRLA
jgi:hypothetical protein